MFDELLNIVQGIPAISQLLGQAAALRAGEELTARGVAGSLDACLLALFGVTPERQILFVARNRDAALRVTDDLRLLSDPLHTFHLGARPIARKSGDAEHAAVEDVESLRALATGSAKRIVTQADSLTGYWPSRESLKGLLTTVRKGEPVGFDALLKILEGNGFNRKEFIEETGDFAVRGGIVDVFPFVGENPVRVEFFGDTIESLREFDPLSQRSIKELETASIVPDLLAPRASEELEQTVFDLLDDDALVVVDEPDLVFRSIGEGEGGNADRARVDRIRASMTARPLVAFSGGMSAGSSTIDVASVAQPSFNGSVRVLKQHLRRLIAREAQILITCDGQSELTRLRDLLKQSAAESGEPAQDDGDEPGVPVESGRIRFIHHSLHEGFELPAHGISFLTEHQIFGRRKRRGKRRGERRKGISLRELQQLRRNDFVVHADYGIGMFERLEKVSVQGIDHEVLKILYDGGDVLYVNLNYVNRIQKYSSKEGHIPRLHRLGSSEWQKLRSRAKGRLKDIARDLIRLYAERKAAPGFAFQPDTPWQKELEASFVFEDTFDQAKATLDVKNDMESPHPMDRLICGDVGFGKTEVAVRAAFKAVMNGKQVAVLVPTTILALQHLNTFIDRLSKYGVQVAALSRLKSKAEQSQILERLKTGSVDVLIGTHRLLSRDVSFRELGLLIVDEEHRFGVAAKEKLRERRAGVDTLTLTATPIPRTLHFSLMGARDLSLIASPPRNRLPIITEIVTFSDELIREAILREHHRGGQVYVVHDRVQDIADFTQRLRSIVPEVRTGYAHGQMHVRELESVMIEFLERKLDVLVSTKIIESGLDIPNVNTIIINRADRFGMAELYQLRGRVGRSNVQAYAFLVAPPLTNLTTEAVRRLTAMREFTELGTGFNLAMRDLEIRGAGNLLGSEQSGFIANMGFETYIRTLEEAVTELREEEFTGLFEKERKGSPEDTIIDADVEALIPSAYISNGNERLEIYRRLYNVTSREQVLEVGEELRDRFGVHPNQVRSLLEILILRIEASRLGFRKVRVTRRALELETEKGPGQWSDEKLAAFVSGISAISDRSVTLQESKTGLLIRVRMEQSEGMLSAAQKAVRMIGRLLEGRPTA